jgi:hypothetical protein
MPTTESILADLTNVFHASTLQERRVCIGFEYFRYFHPMWHFFQLFRAHHKGHVIESIDLFKQLHRNAQVRCAIKLRKIMRGEA